MNIKKSLTVATAATLAGLALPAMAAAHPSTYETIAKVVTSPAGVTPVTTSDQKHYLVTEHGYVVNLKETNGLTAHGVLNYKVLPSGLRSTMTKEKILATSTGAQAHATCQGVKALSSESNILAWQEADPFFDYVPFQKNSAGLADDPSTWIPVVKAATGVDLSTVSDVAAACTGLGGTYTAADATNATGASLASGLLADAVAPLNAQVTDLKSQIASLTANVNTLTSEKAVLTGQVSKLSGEKTTLAKENSTLASQVSALKAQIAPVKGTTPVSTISAAALAASGVQIQVVGPANGVAKVELRVSAKSAKKIGLKRTRIGFATTKFDASGNGSVRVLPSAEAGPKLRKFKGKVRLAIELSAGNGQYITSIGLNK